MVIARELASENRAYEGLVTKFLEHFAESRRRCPLGALGRDGRLLLRPPGQRHGRRRAPRLRYRSLVGVCPLAAVALGLGLRSGPPTAGFRKWFAAFNERRRGEDSVRSSWGRSPSRPRRPGAALRGRPGEGCSGCWRSPGRGESLSRPRAPLPLEAPPRAPLHLPSAASAPPCLRAGGVPQAHWRQLQLAGPGLVPPSYLVVEALGRYHASWARLHRGVPRRLPTPPYPAAVAAKLASA